MNKSLWTVALASALLAGGIAVRAEDTPAAAPAKAPTTKPSASKLFEPYTALTDVTEDQLTKIKEIHKKYLADEKALKEKQTSDIAALLTDAQKAELEKFEADRRQKMVEAAAKKKSEDAAK